MDLKNYLASLPSEDERQRFAAGCDTTIGHLRNVSYGLRRPAPNLCVILEVKSGQAMTRRELRPDDWHRIWPELVTRKFPAPADKAPV